MRRKHFVIVPVFLIAALILWVIIGVDSLPVPARLVGGAIASLALIIFIIKHLKMERELRNGKVDVISGVITEKRKMGGNFKSVSTGAGVSSGSTGRPSNTTFFIFIDQKKFTVPSTIYSRVKEGDRVEFDYFPNSQFCLGIRVIAE